MKFEPDNVSIIIRTFNEEKLIGKLLDEIIRQKVSFGYEIILVDSGSTDKTIEIAIRHNVNLVQISSEEFSFRYSLNRGIESAKMDICVIISAHCHPTDRFWLQNLVSPFKNNNVALVYGKQTGYDSTKFSEQRIFTRWFPKKSLMEQNHPFCNNANAAVRRSIWKEVKYNEQLTGLEDIDWANRVLPKGYKVAYVAEACVFHIHDETNQQIYQRFKREAIAFKRIFPTERFTFLDFFHSFFMHVLRDYIHAFRARVFIDNSFQIMVFRLLQFYGTYRGHKFKDTISTDLKRRFYYPNRSKFLGSSKIIKMMTMRESSKKIV